MGATPENVGTAIALLGGTLTPTLTITAANLLVVGVGYVDGGSQTTSVTWDVAGANQGLTLLKRQREAVSTGYAVDLWYLLSPTPGSSKLVTVVMSGATNTGVWAMGVAGANVIAGAAGAFGDTTLTGGTADTEAGPSDPVTVTVLSGAGQLVVDIMVAATLSTVGADQTMILDDITTGTQFGGSYQDGALGGTMTWTKDGGGTQNWAIAAVSILPPVAAGVLVDWGSYVDWRMPL